MEAVAARNNHQGNFADAWSGFSFFDEVLSFESGLIRQALSEAKGVVTRAARLLGISHQALVDMLKGRHSDLQEQRKPPIRRKKSIMNKEKFEKMRKVKRKGNILSH